MAVASENTTSVSSATTSDWVVLKRGKNRVYISCGTWSTTSVTLQTSHDASTAFDVYVGDISTKATANSTTGNLAIDVDGPGYVRLNCTAYAASAVTLLVNSPIANRL